MKPRPPTPAGREAPGRAEHALRSWTSLLDGASLPGYLGDHQVVNSLLRTYAARVLTASYDGPADLTKTAREGAHALAKVFLGQDKQYSPMPRWNAPGHLDAYIARREGVDSDDPEERVAVGLGHLIRDLLRLAHAVQEHQLLEEQWQFQVTETLQKYVRLFLGIPEAGV